MTPAQRRVLEAMAAGASVVLEKYRSNPGWGYRIGRQRVYRQVLRTLVRRGWVGRLGPFVDSWEAREFYITDVGRALLKELEP